MKHWTEVILARCRENSEYFVLVALEQHNWTFTL